MSKQQVQIQLLGRSYQLKCDEQQLPTLQQAAAYIEESMQETLANSQLSFADAALLTALNAYGELFAEQTTTAAPTEPANNTALSSADLAQMQKLEQAIKAL